MKHFLLITLLSFFSYSGFGQCDPTGLAANNTTLNGAILSWSANSATGFSVKWKISGTPGWSPATPGVYQTATNITVDTLFFDTLTSGTTYEWRVRPYGCTPTSTWTDGPAFTTLASCPVSALQNVAGFNPDPVYALWHWCYDTLTLTNTSSCDIRVRPEFDLSHDSSPITLTDFDLKWYNPGGLWQDINYTIDANGHAIGIWGFPMGDTTGVVINSGVPQPIVVRVRFRPSANYGTYSALWKTNEVDSLGNVIQPLALDSTSLRFFNCSSFGPDSTTFDSVSCPGALDGSAEVFVNGSGSYSYTWKLNGDTIFGETTSSISNLSGGLYECISYEDTFQCSHTENFIINEPSVIDVNIIGTHISCFDSSDGTLNAIASGGSGTYKYAWTDQLGVPLPPNPSHSNLSAGIYSITLIDMGGCTGSVTDNFEIIEPGAIQDSTIKVNNLSCNPLLPNGSINLYLSGGTLPYSISWSNGDSVEIRNNLAANPPYTITVTDSNNCPSISISETITNTPTTPSATNNVTDNTSCNSQICNGEVSTADDPGATPYTYSWSNFATTATITGLCANSYTLTITDTNSCSTTLAAVNVQNSANLPQVAISSTNLQCAGDSVGSATIFLISNLSYCASSPGSNDYTNIEMVKLVGDGDSIVNNTAGQCDTYEDYTSQNATVSAGQSYYVDVNIGSCNPTGGAVDSIGIFFDWNIDGDFDDVDEKIMLLDEDTALMTQLPAPPHTITFTVPNNAIAGVTRMRIVSQYQGSGSGPVSACDVGTSAPTYNQPWYGATEDYTVTISGGTPPSYLWSNGDTTQQISNLTEGTYTCTVTDSSGCSNSGSVTIIEPSPILVVENITHINCFGDSTGTASLIISGGTPPYSLNWYSSDTNLLFAGEHNYTITDAMGCIYNDSIMIDQPQQTLSIISSKINVNCFGENNGSIDITTNGGSGTHSYSWIGPNGFSSAFEDLSGLVSGEYSVIVNDTSNCILYDTINISEPAILQIDSVSVIQQTSCANPNGSIDIEVTGGTTSYNYLWSNAANSQDLNFLIADTYSVIVTDQNLCTDSVGFTISLATTPININFTTSNYNGTAISCYNASDGSIFSEATGGEGTLNYSWPTLGSTNDTVNNLGPGSYTLTITDSVGCTNSDTISLTQPGLLSANHVLSQSSCTGANAVISVYLDITGGTAGYQENWYGDNPDTLLPGVLYTYTITDTNNCILTDTFTANFATPLIVDVYQTDVLCHGDSSGAATVVVSGGSPPYNYLWNNGNTNPTAINLIAGTYTCTISDQSGCSFDTSTTVSQPVNSLSATSSLIDSINCFGYNTGSAYISADGGVPFTTGNEYTYLWEDGQTDSIASNLFGGYNIYSVTDDNGCLLTDSILIPENDSIFTTNTLSNNNAFNISCNGGNDGSIDITINGGVAPFIINWSNGQDSTFIDSLIADTYYLSITDTFGCSFNDTISLIEPTSIIITSSQTNVSCNGYLDGSLTISAVGGVPNYFFSGLGFGYYTTAGGTATFNGLGDTTLVYNYLDQNGCSETESIIITEPGIIDPILSISNYNGVNISCKGFDDGYINIDSITGGNGGYDIIWIDQISGDTIINGDSLTVGYYNLTINDSIGCPPYNNTFFISEPDFALDSYIDSFDVSCNSYCDGQLIATAFDGTGPYTYDWTFPNGNTLSNDTLIGCEGNYSLTITDANGCTNQLSSTLIEPSPLSINLDLLVDASFYGATNGSIQTHATGGNGGYNYLWDSGQNTSNIYGLSAGQYELAINDLLGCVDTALFIINEPPPIAINFDSTYSILSTSCYDNCDGSIFIDPVISPNAFYTCYWEGPNGYTSTLEDITGLCEGTYTINIITSGDSIPFTFVVNEPDQLTTSLATDSIMCYGSTALVSAYTYGGTTPYSYSWSTNNINNISNYLPEGNHTVTITDANGCIVQDSLSLSNPDTMNIYFASVIEISCNNGSDGEITVSVMSGGTPSYEYSIDNGINYNTSNVFDNLSSGSYTITVKDGNDCKQSIDTTIINPAPIDIQVDIMNTDTMVSCDGFCDAEVIFDYVFVNGIGNSSWEQWSVGATNGSLCPGLYNCTLTDDNGCSTTINNIEITEPDLLEFDTIWSTPTTCHNYGDDGSAYADGSGGTAPLQYLWSNGEVNQTTTNTLNTGQHSCTITDVNGCTATESIQVLSNPVPFYIGISYNQTDTILTWDGNSTGGTPVSFEWNTGETSQNITPLNNGIYWALGTDANGCVSDTAFYTVTNFVTSISDITNLFKIYPNPTNGLINVYSKENIETIEVFNNLGDLIYSKNNTQHSQELYQLDISGNASGIYMIRLKVNNQIVNHKIILQ
jgi:hypothetical protein